MAADAPGDHDRITRRFDGAYGSIYDAVVSRPVALRGVSFALGADNVLPRIPALVQQAFADAPGEPLLDVPCGAFGSLAHGATVDRAGTVVGLDLAEEMLARARARVREISTPFAIDVVHGDALDLPFDDASFGAVLSINGLHCMPDHVAFVHSVARVLRPGGTFTLTTLVDRPSLLSRTVNGAFHRAHVLPGPPPTPTRLDKLLDDAGLAITERIDGRVFVARRCLRRSA